MKCPGSGYPLTGGAPDESGLRYGTTHFFRQLKLAHHPQVGTQSLAISSPGDLAQASPSPIASSPRNLDQQVAIGIDGGVLAGQDQGGGVELVDDRGACEVVAAGEQSAVVDGAGNEAADLG